jgi:hypothetical protein
MTLLAVVGPGVVTSDQGRCNQAEGENPDSPMPLHKLFFQGGKMSALIFSATLSRKAIFYLFVLLFESLTAFEERVGGGLERAECPENKYDDFRAKKACCRGGQAPAKGRFKAERPTQAAENVLGFHWQIGPDYFRPYGRKARLPPPLTILGRNVWTLSPAEDDHCLINA